ncbi:hypothetical protein, partial [Leptospira bandrabouensis]|uniref:hypothetical protein n=1 Tax=Leptospira bandrabouensis TaxID=2484903 RepID=UPI001EEC023C
RYSPQFLNLVPTFILYILIFLLELSTYLKESGIFKAKKEAIMSKLFRTSTNKREGSPCRLRL